MSRRVCKHYRHRVGRDDSAAEGGLRAEAGLRGVTASDELSHYGGWGFQTDGADPSDAACHDLRIAADDRLGTEATSDTREQAHAVACAVQNRAPDCALPASPPHVAAAHSAAAQQHEADGTVDTNSWLPCISNLISPMKPGRPIAVIAPFAPMPQHETEAV